MAKQIRDIKDVPLDMSRYKYIEGRPILIYSEFWLRNAEKHNIDLQQLFPGYNIVKQIKWEEAING